MLRSEIGNEKRIQARMENELVVSMEESDLADFVSRKRAERQLSVFVRALNHMLQESIDERQVVLEVLKRMGLGLGG